MTGEAAGTAGTASGREYSFIGERSTKGGCVWAFDGSMYPFPTATTHHGAADRPLDAMVISAILGTSRT